jgi:hypothetical protein
VDTGGEGVFGGLKKGKDFQKRGVGIVDAEIDRVAPVRA